MIYDTLHIANITALAPWRELADAKTAGLKRKDTQLKGGIQVEGELTVSIRITAAVAATGTLIAASPNHFHVLPEWLETMRIVNTQKNLGLKLDVKLLSMISNKLGHFLLRVTPKEFDDALTTRHRKPGCDLVVALRKIVCEHYGGTSEKLTGPLPEETFARMCELYRADENVRMVQTWVRA